MIFFSVKSWKYRCCLPLLQDFQLEAQAVYVRAGQWLIRRKQYASVRQLLKCVGESGTATKNDCDALILNYISCAEKGPADVSDRIAMEMHVIGIFIILTILQAQCCTLILRTILFDMV